jgi:transposase
MPGEVEVAGERVATEMALHVLAYNLTRVMNILGIQPLLAGMRA